MKPSAMPKTWTQKFHNGRVPVVVTLTKPSGGIPAGKKLLIPTPAQVRDYMEKVPAGVTVPVTTMRADRPLSPRRQCSD